MNISNSSSNNNNYLLEEIFVKMLTQFNDDTFFPLFPAFLLIISSEIQLSRSLSDKLEHFSERIRHAHVEVAVNVAVAAAAVAAAVEKMLIRTGGPVNNKIQKISVSSAVSVTLIPAAIIRA